MGLPGLAAWLDRRTVFEWESHGDEAGRSGRGPPAAALLVGVRLCLGGVFAEKSLGRALCFLVSCIRQRAAGQETRHGKGPGTAATVPIPRSSGSPATPSNGSPRTPRILCLMTWSTLPSCHLLLLILPSPEEQPWQVRSTLPSTGVLQATM